MTKTLYTGYYARHGNDPRSVSISVAVPKWFPKMQHYAPLAPTWKLVEAYKMGTVSIKQYTEAYLEMLAERGKTAQQMVDELPDRAILLCYEKPPEFCHRHVAAAWLLKQGADVRFSEHT